MAIGYIIALVLIGAGSALFVAGLLIVRHENRARVRNLRLYLKTGVVPAAPMPEAQRHEAPSRRTGELVRLPTACTPQAEAAQALRRAYYSARVRSAAA